MTNNLTRAMARIDNDFRALHRAKAELKYYARVYQGLTEIPPEKTNPESRAIALRWAVMCQLDSVIEQATASGNGESVRPLRDLCNALNELQVSLINPLLRSPDDGNCEAGTDEANTVASICAARKDQIISKYRP